MLGSSSTLAACPVSNMPTTYIPKSRCSHWTSMSAPWNTFITRGSAITGPSASRINPLSSNASTTKSIRRVETCMTHVNPWNERYEWCSRSTAISFDL